MRMNRLIATVIYGCSAGFLWIVAPLMPFPLLGWVTMLSACLLALGCGVSAFLTVFGEED